MRTKFSKEVSVLALSIASFCLAMGLRGVLNIWIGTGTAALISVLLLRRIDDDIPARWFPTSTSAIVSGTAIGVAMAVGTWVLFPVSAELVPAIGVEVPRLYDLLRQPPGPVWALPVLVFVVLTEELVWRGLAIDVFGQSVGPARAVLLASLAYVLPQIAFRSPLLVVIALVCGAIWGALRVMTNGLAAPLIAHLTWDVLVFVLFPVS